MLDKMKNEEITAQLPEVTEVVLVDNLADRDTCTPGLVLKKLAAPGNLREILLLRNQDHQPESVVKAYCSVGPCLAGWSYVSGLDGPSN